MTLLDFFKNLSMGGWTSFFIMLCLLIEITPIKINPIGWLGNRLNAGMNKRVDKIEFKLDDHITEGFRNAILNFQRVLINNPNGQFTEEEWGRVLDNCQKYERFCKDNDVDNGVIIESTKFIKSQYQEALKTNNILILPTQEVR